jgi:hypothetical protein
MKLVVNALAEAGANKCSACDYSEIWGKVAGIGLMDFLHVAQSTATRIVLDAEISTTLAA